MKQTFKGFCPSVMRYNYETVLSLHFVRPGATLLPPTLYNKLD